MWRNEKYESVPLDVKEGVDEDNSKGTRDSLYPGSAVSHNNRGKKNPLHTFNFKDKDILPVPLMFSCLSSTASFAIQTLGKYMDI